MARAGPQNAPGRLLQSVEQSSLEVWMRSAALQGCPATSGRPEGLRSERPP